ncbi:MAG: hypothetical protein IJO56_06065 [Oscillospiraceae bacterium]|nr:hypothetical protein [Oscillospiraceae bacterium]
MKVIDVYTQYFEASCVYNDALRRAALVRLTSTYDNGNIKYDVSVNFFPFRDPEDFSVTHDALFSTEIYSAKGRRSKKREAEFMNILRNTIDSLCPTADAVVFWDKPLREARYG